MNKPLCKALKKNGQPCNNRALTDDGWCWAHAPENAEQRKQIASNAGKGNRTTITDKIEEVRNMALGLSVAVAKGERDRANTAVALTGLGVVRGYLALELKAREQDEIIDKLNELEQMIMEQTGGGEASVSWIR